MNEALKEAIKAEANDEVPVGAVVVSNNIIIARSHNSTELLNDVTAHAEIMAITAASSYLGSKYLNDCTIYVTLEPCLMCAAALSWAQIGKIIWGANDNKKGYSINKINILHPKTTTKSGVLEIECSNILKNFFEKKRNISKQISNNNFLS